VKRFVVLAGLGLLVPIFQGAVAAFLPRGVCPDLGLLLVIALGVALRSTATGLAVSAWLGFVSDLLSGALLGQHALLRVLAFGVARLTSSHMNLQGPFTQMGLAAGLTLASALGMLALTAFFDAGTALVFPAAPLFWHTAVNALCAPFVMGIAVRGLAKLEDDGRRPLRLEPRSFST
jgi:rod shape-determining protein MreD